MNIDILKEKINLAIENNENIKKYIDMEEYAFEKLIDLWNEYEAFDDIDIDLNKLNSLKSEDILKEYDIDSKEYRFLILIYKLISYIDVKAYNKNEFNEYEDKRTLAFTGIIPPDWVKNLINYKKDKNFNNVTDVAKNVIKYIINPEDTITIFKTNKLERFTNILPIDENIKENDYENLCKIIYKQLDKCNIKVKNNKNLGKVYGEVIFSKELVYL